MIGSMVMGVEWGGRLGEGGSQPWRKKQHVPHGWQAKEIGAITIIPGGQSMGPCSRRSAQTLQWPGPSAPWNLGSTHTAQHTTPDSVPDSDYGSEGGRKVQG